MGKLLSSLITDIIILTLSAVIVLAGLTASAGEAGDFTYTTYQVEDEEGNIISETNPEEIETLEGIKAQMVADYESAVAMNSDVTGVLYVPNIGYFVIPQGDDNEYYLNHNAQGLSYNYGTPFMNARCDGSYTDIALIHGHHLNDGSVFGSLSKYKDADFFSTNPNMWVYDGEYFREYQVYTVFLYNDTTETLSVDFSSDSSRLAYMEELQARGIQQADVDLTQPMLLLVTCDYTYDNARLCIGAAQVGLEIYRYTDENGEAVTTAVRTYSGN